MRIGINCGHTISGKPGSGAVGYLIESDETRAVGYALMEMLRAQGHTVIDCTNDVAASESENLKNIVTLANAQHLDAFYSIHFNSGGGTGTEIYTYGGRDTANASIILENITQLGFSDRGIKNGSNLYVIRHTHAPAALIEVCFVDSGKDAQHYRKLDAKRIAEAICFGIDGKEIEESEELTMTQYEELKQEIHDLTETVKALAEEIYDLKHPMIYNYIDENMPEWARPTVQKLVNEGILKGDETGLNLTDEMLRILVILDRMMDSQTNRE